MARNRKTPATLTLVAIASVIVMLLSSFPLVEMFALPRPASLPDATPGTLPQDLELFSEEPEPDPPEAETEAASLEPGTVNSVYDAADGAPVSIASLNTTPTMTANDTLRTYFTDYGRFTSSLDTPYILNFTDSTDFSIIRATTIVPEADGVEVEIANAFVASETDNDTYVVTYDALVSGVVQGNMTLVTQIYGDAAPKLNATFVPVGGGPLANARLVWLVIANATYLKTDNNESNDTTIDLYTYTSLTQVAWPDEFVQIGDQPSVANWSVNSTISWEDEGNGTLWAGSISIGTVQSGMGVAIKFPNGDHVVDPSLVGSAQTTGGLSFQMQRKTFFWDGYYWVWWLRDNNLNYKTSRDGFNWSGEHGVGCCFVTGFDVYASGNLIFLTWVQDNNIYGQLGTIKGDEATKINNPYNWLYTQDRVVDWFAFQVIDTVTESIVSPVSGVIGSDGFLWAAAIFRYSTTDTVRVFRSVAPYDTEMYAEHYFTYGSPTSGINFGRGAVKLVALEDGNVTVLMAPEGSSHLRYLYYSPTAASAWTYANGSSSDVKADLLNPNGNHSMQISALRLAGDKTGVAFLGGNGNVRYIEIGRAVATDAVDVKVKETQNILSAPSIGRDLNNALYIVWVRQESSPSYEGHKLLWDDYIDYARWSSLTGWSASAQVFKETHGVVALQIPELIFPAMLLVWIHPKPLGADVYATTIQIPLSAPAAVGTPWGGEGLNPGGSFTGELGYTVSLATGQLIYRAVDLEVPARGLPLSVARIYQTTRYFDASSNLQYVEASPYAPMGDGWSLDFPWISPNFIYLPGGGRVAYAFGVSNEFVNNQGVPFKARKAMDGGTSVVTVEFSTGIKMEFRNLISANQFVLNWTQDNPSTDPANANRINFSYANGRLSSIKDPTGRSVNFSYAGSPARLSVIGYQGSAVMSYGYNAQGLLGSVADALDNHEWFNYTDAPYFLRNVTFFSGGRAEFNFGAGPVRVGPDTYTVLTTRIEVFNLSRDMTTAKYLRVRSTSIGYDMVNGIIVHTVIKVGDGTVRSQREEMSSPVRGYRVTLNRDGWGNLLQKSVTWINSQGQPFKIERFMGNDTNATSTDYVQFDDWGNPIYARDINGYEVFTSYANTIYENEYRSTSRFELGASGRLLTERFENWSSSSWATDMTVCSTPCLLLNSSLFDPPSINVSNYATSSSSKYASRTFPRTQDVWMFAAVRPVLGGGRNLIELKDGATTKVYIEFNETNQIRWCGGSPVYCENSFSSFSPGVWYKLGVVVTGSSGTFTVYLDGKWMLDGALSYDGSSSFFVDTVKFSALTGSTGQKAEFHVNEVFVSKGVPVANVAGLPVGATVELADAVTGRWESARVTSGSLSLSAASMGGSVSRIRVRDFDGSELADVPLVLVGSETYRFVRPGRIAAVTLVDSGFGRLTQSIADDVLLPRNARALNYGDGLNLIFDEAAAPSGSAYHASSPVAGKHYHGFEHASTSWTVPTGSYLIQYVYLMPGATPSEVALRYNRSSGAPAWFGAYWGKDSLGLGFQKMQGNLPAGQWLQLIVKSDLLGAGGASIDGINYMLWGGAARWDLSSIGDSDTGYVSLRGLESNQLVKLLRPDGSIIAFDTSGANGVVRLGAYPTVSVFPLAARFSIYKAGSSTEVEHRTALLTSIWAGDNYTYKKPDFYGNGDIASVNGSSLHQALVGSVSWDNGRETVSLDMETNTTIQWSGQKPYLVDFSGYRHNATVSGPVDAAGKVGQAKDFRAGSTNDYVSIPADNDSAPERAMGIAFWIKPDTFNSNYNKINLASWGAKPTSDSNKATSTYWYVDLLKSTGGTTTARFVVGFSDGSIRTLNATNAISTADWNHLAATFDGHRVVLYVNGTERDSAAEEGKVIRWSSLPVVLGQGSDSSDVNYQWSYFDGRMDEVRIYPRAISEEQVRQLYALENSTSRKSYFKYNETGLLTESKTEALTDTWSKVTWLITTIQYDAYRNPVRQTAPNGQTTYYNYTANPAYTYLNNTSVTVEGTQNVQHWQVDDKWGRILNETSPMGYVTSYSYDAIGRPLQQKQPTGTNGARPTVNWTYDDRNRTVTEQAPSGWITTSYYDGIDRVERVARRASNGFWGGTIWYYYNHADQIRDVYDPLQNKYNYTYDESGRLKQVRGPDQSVKTWAYDNALRKIRATDQENNVTDYYYDVVGRLQMTCQWPTGSPDDCKSPSSTAINVTVDYDLAGQLVWQRDSRGWIQSWDHGQRGQVTIARYADGTRQTSSFGMNRALGRSYQETRDGLFSVTNLTYDGIGRLMSIDYPGASTEDVTNQYDADSRLTASLSTKFSYAYEYNSWGQVTRKNITYNRDDAPNKIEKNLYLSYDGYGRLSRLTYPDSAQVDYTYDKATPGDYMDRVWSVAGNWGGSAYAFEYNPRGQVTQYVDATTATTLVSHSYDSNARLTSIAVGSGATARTWSYTYYKNGNVKTDPNGTYNYDAVGRLVQVANSPWGTLNYGYDKNGNRNGTDDGRPTYYNYTAGNVLVNLSSPAYQGQAAYSATYTHDANGRMTGYVENAGANEWSYTYDSAERLSLVRVGAPLAERARYWYGPDGEMLKRTEYTTTTEYYFPLGGQVIYSWVATNPTESRDYIFANGLAIAVRVSNGAPEYLFQDAGGNIRLAYSQASTITREYRYRPFGAPETIGTPTLTMDFRFAGNNERDAVKLSFFHARWYNAALGRFLTRDPIEGSLASTQELDLYVYAWNNPKTFVDAGGTRVQVSDWYNWLTLGVAGLIADTINWWNQATDEEKAGMTNGLIVAVLIGILVGISCVVAGCIGLVLLAAASAAGLLGSAAAAMQYVRVTRALGGTPTAEGVGVAFGLGGLLAGAAFGGTYAAGERAALSAARKPVGAAGNAEGGLKGDGPVGGGTNHDFGASAEALNYVRTSPNFAANARREASYFFGKAGGKASGFKVIEYPGGGYKLQYWKPAKTFDGVGPYGKKFVAMINSNGERVAELSYSPKLDGTLKVNWIFGNPGYQM